VTGDAARRSGVRALLLIAASVLLQLIVGQLGPSVAVPPLSPDQDRQALANGWLVTGLLALALILGGLGLWLGLRAVRAGWRPSPRRLLAGAALAVLVLLIGPPLGTADLGGYAAYGRMSVLHRDPYATKPSDLTGDPVADAAEKPWREAKSIYGPLATAEFRVAAELGGTSREAVLRLLQCASGLAFVGTGLLLDRRLAGSGPGTRARGALLWSGNPLLLHQLVAGGHLDSLLSLLVAAGVAVVCSTSGRARPEADASAWRPLVSGVLLGLAGLVKATAGAPAVGLAVGALGGRRDLRRFGLFAGAGLVVAGVGYAAAGGTSALAPTREASRMVSRGSPWRFVASGLERLLPHDAARTVVGLLALAAAVWLAVRLYRALPQLDSSLRCALAATVAWLVLAPYSLPWYDAVAWALVAMVAVQGHGSAAVSRIEGWLLLHMAFLSVAYLPGRVVGLSDGIVTAQDVVRGAIAPVVTLMVAVGLARVGIGQGRSGERRSAAGPESSSSETTLSRGRESR
jgi:hypothetical protein